MTTASASKRPDIREQAVDEVLARRLATDPSFAGSFAAVVARQTGVTLDGSVFAVRQQVRHGANSGTVDIEARLVNRGTVSCALLIENKIDAGFTPTQPMRYAASVQARRARGERAWSVLCCPAAYATASRHAVHFDIVVSYESMIDWLAGGDRALLEDAIRRFAMPYEPVNVPEVQDFFTDYARICAEIAPSLALKRNPNTAGERPDGSHTIYFDVKACLPRWDFLPTLRFSHQCWDSGAKSPSVKIMIEGWAAHLGVLGSAAAADLSGTGLYLRKAGRSLGIVRDTPRLDHTRRADGQRWQIEDGIRSAAMLQSWLQDNETCLRRWAAAILASH